MLLFYLTCCVLSALFELGEQTQSDKELNPNFLKPKFVFAAVISHYVAQVLVFKLLIEINHVLIIFVGCNES